MTMVYDTIGADTAQPVWMRAVMVQEGDDVVTRCCVVTEGQFFPIEIRVNLPQLAAQLRTMGVKTGGQDQVGAFGFLKKAARAVTKNKLVKAVGKVVTKTVKSPVFQVAASVVAPGVAPGLLLGAHNASTFTGGKGIFKGPVKAIVDTTSKAALATVLPGVGPKALEATQKLGTALRGGKSPLSVLPAIGAGALDFVSPQAAAALGVGLKTVNAANVGSKIAAAAKLVQNQVNLGRTAASALQQKTVPAANVAAATQLVRNAVLARQNATRLAPYLAKNAVFATKVKTSLATIAAKAKQGNPDAKLASRVLATSAKALSDVEKLKSQATGGLPGLLVTATGRIVKAPKTGRFIQRSTTATNPDVLYRGPKSPLLKGQFTAAVSGAFDEFIVSGDDFVGGNETDAWGGGDDPGNDIEGPRYPATHPDGNVELEDWSAIGGVAVAGLLTP